MGKNTLKISLNATHLKIIAMVLMLIDHSGFILFGDNAYMRMIGRLSFPIFAFCTSESLKHTHDIKAYMKRLFIFAFISSIPYSLVHNNFNVIWTFLFASVCVFAINKEKFNKGAKIFIVIIILCLSELLKTDYGAYGILTVLVFYMFGNSLQSYIGLLILTICFGGDNIQLWCMLSVFILMFYNNKKGRGMKYLFYIFYPLHLFILWAIHNLLAVLM